MDAYELVLLVQQKYDEVLPIDLGKIRVQKRTCVSRATYLLLVTVQSAFTYQGYPIHGYAIGSIR